MAFVDIAAPNNSGNLQGEAVNVGTRSARDQLPDLELSPPFLLMAHPNRWMVIEGEDGPELLPELATLPVEPGIGNVNEHTDPSLAIAHRTRRDWIIIPNAQARPSDTPDGNPGYVRRYRGRRGLTHLTAWNTLRVVAGQAIHGTNQKSYYAWLRRLLRDGVIPAPDPDIIEAMLDRARTRADRAGSRDQTNELAARLREQAVARVASLERLVQSDEGVELAPEPPDEGESAQPEPAKTAPKRRQKE